jgi:hypothetical protein
VSPKLPAVKSKELAGIAQRLGFEFRRQPSTFALAITGGWSFQCMPVKISSQRHYEGIIDDLGITVEEFQRML